MYENNQSQKKLYRLLNVPKVILFSILPSLLYEKYEIHCKEYCEFFWSKYKLKPMDFGIGIKLKTPSHKLIATI